MEPLLTVDRLQTVFQTEKEELISVDDVSFQIRSGETIGIVGESGCGKSVTAFSLMGLLGKTGLIKKGSIHFNGKELNKLPQNELRKIRGNDISMIFQEPMTSLNPVYSIGNQMIEGIMLHKKMKKKDAKKYAIDMLNKVSIPRADEIFNEYPHSLSGGMRQRVMIAMALACQPKLLVADEPTTALDVTIQAQILELMKRMREEFGTAILLITHDLGVVAEMADKVVVMYAGQVVEEADVFKLFDEPKHPYTKGLMASIPQLEYNPEERLVPISGNVPPLNQMPQGCRFHARCSSAKEQCEVKPPPLVLLKDGHRVRCWLYDEAPGVF